MGKITFQHADPTYHQVDVTPTPEAILVPQGKYTHLLYNIRLVPSTEASANDATMHEPMPEHYEAERIELEGAADYGTVINAIVRDRYSQSQVEAILCNGGDTPEHQAELEAFQQWRKESKRIAKMLNDAFQKNN